GDFIGAANQPRVVRGTILLEFLEQLGQPGVKQPLGSVPMELQRQVGRPGHNPNSLRRQARKGEPGRRRGDKRKRSVLRERSARETFTAADQVVGVGCAARFCFTSLTLSTRSSACFW